LPGVLRNCRGNAGEALVYAGALALWQRRLAGLIDAAIVPSEFALRRLRELGAPLPPATHVLANPVRAFAERSQAASGGYALFAGRLEPEKGLEVAIEACRIAGMPLSVAGEGSQGERFAGTAGVSFTGPISDERLSALRAGAALALMPSLTGETFGLAAAQAMAAGVPVAASDIGALRELVPAQWRSPAGDAPAMAATIGALRADAGAGDIALARARELLDPLRLAATLGRIYS
jgi:glycosyltransferase involved in cell wall biosynthesis